MTNHVKDAKQKHFSRYIARHLLVIFAIFALALTIGYIMKGAAGPSNNMLANTSSSYDSTTTSSMYITQTSSLPPPSQLFLQSKYPSQVVFSWIPVSGATEYKIFRNGVFMMAGITGTTYTDITVFPGQTYFYQVKSAYQQYESYEKSPPLYVDVPLETTQDPLSTTITGTTNTTTTSLSPVMFTVEQATDGITCEDGKTPATEVHFIARPINGGDFSIYSPITQSHSFGESGPRMLPNGTYYWEGIAKQGFSKTGTFSGSFTLNNTCPPVSDATSSTTTASMLPLSGTTTSSLTTPTTVPTTNTTVTVPTATQTTTENTSVQTQPTAQMAPITPPPQMKVFLDNKPITDAKHVFNEEDIEMRVTTSPAKKITLFAVATPPRTLGYAVKDDLLSKQETEIWSYTLEAEKEKAGVHKVFARVLRMNGVVAETAPILLYINHPVAQTVTKTITENSASNTEALAASQQEEEKTRILARISDPASCANAKECAVYCENSTGGKEACSAYSQFLVRTAAVDDRPSLVDGVPAERLENLFSNEEKRPREIPLAVENTDDLKSFCADSAHTVVCSKVLIRHDLASEETLAANKETVIRAKEAENKLFTERIGARSFVDTDHDSIVDYDEINLYRTDPNDPDTDHDGFHDGAEILSRTNPRGGLPITSSSTSPTTTPTLSDENIHPENPFVSGSTEEDFLAVTNVQAAKMSTSSMTGKLAATGIAFTGKALPNSFVTLYIFSEPIVVTVKADESGVWTYTLDKELADGTHQVVTAIADEDGRIMAKSEPLPFVKEATAVSMNSRALLPANQEPGFFSGASLYAFIAIVIGILGVAFSVIGFTVRRREDNNEPNVPA